MLATYEGVSERADLDRTALGREETPACHLSTSREVEPPTFFDTSSAAQCLELDLDFGASPQLHRVKGEHGTRLRVAALQKAGVLHDVLTAHAADERGIPRMLAAWRATTGPGGAAMSGATGAVGKDTLYVGGTPDLLEAVDATSGSLRWATHTGVDAFAYQPLTLAAGVLYTVTDAGQLMGFRASDGRQLLSRSIAADLGRDASGCLGAGAGVAVARGTVYVPCDSGGQHDLTRTDGPPGGLVAYRPRGAARAGAGAVGAPR